MQNKTDKGTSLVSKSLSLANSNYVYRLFSARKRKCYDSDYVIKIPYTDMGNNLVSLPVTINGMGVEMIFYTGASSTTISLQEAQYLAKHGKLEEDDILGVQKFGTADGNTSNGLIIKLKELVIGNKITVSNTYATVVMNQEAPLLLGGSVFTQFREVSVDREEHIVKFCKY